MLQNWRFGPASILASILALSGLLTLVETQAQRLATNEQLNTAPEPPKVLDLPALARLTQLDQAYLDVFNILRTDNECSRFYGGPRAIEALNDLKLQLKTAYLDQGIGLRMRGKTSFITNNSSGLSYRLFEKAEVNLNGAFFSASHSFFARAIPGIGEFAANTREARTTILLHELGHLIQISADRFVLPDDGRDASVSMQNTYRVIEVCREQIVGQSQISLERTLASVHASRGTKASQLAAIAEPARSAWSNNNVTHNTP